MRYVLKTRAFSRLAAKAGISDDALCQAVLEMQTGLVDANLGGDVYKKRVSVGNRGKRGGSRTIIATNFGDRWFFLYCFLKKDRENISAKEEMALKITARSLLLFTDEQIQQAVAAGEMEIL